MPFVSKPIALISRTLITMLSAITLGFGGCKNAQVLLNPQIVWSAEVKSPDGKMVATAKAFANGGFGGAGAPATFVYINWATGSQKPMEILEMSNECDTAECGSVGIKWVSSNKLELTYRSGKQEIAFQAVRYVNVEIVLTDVSTTSPTTP